MMPACRGINSHPYQRNQMPLSHCYHPGIEAIPPQIKVDPSKSPYDYEQPWPYAGSYGNLTPVCFCYGHNNFPGYYSYRPAYPHAPASSPIYFYGGCPKYIEPFSVPHSSPPLYIMELPRYEHDICVPRDYRCCRCPNHPCYQEEGRRVKIEEQEPDVEKKVNNALASIQLKNYPYPFIWIPPEYISNGELKNPVRVEVGEQDKISQDRKPPSPGYFRADALEPRVWNGWFPFDISNFRDIIHDGDGRRNHNWQTANNRIESEEGTINPERHSENKIREFPYPIIWMPYYNKLEQGGRTNNQESTCTSKSIEEVSHTFKYVPVNFHAGENVTKETRTNGHESTSTSGLDATEEISNDKGITVKQMELQKGINDSEGSDGRERNISVKKMEENMMDKYSQTSTRKQSTSPGEIFNLPPVCLRVDLLPNKKNGNESSRSPSPPESKELSQPTAGETSKTPLVGMNDKA